MIKKLKQKKGETLMEALVSMLIAVLSMGILCSAALAATKMNVTTRSLDKKYSEQLFAVEGLDETIAEPGKLVVLTFQPGEGISSYTVEKTVTIYGEEESAFLSYDYDGGAE